MPVTASITAAINASLTGGGTEIAAAVASLAQSTSISLTNGTAAGQVDRLFADTRTLAASATEDLDLAGVLTDALGTVATFVKVKAIYIKAAAANTNNVVVGAAAVNAFIGPFGAATHTIALRPGGFVVLACGAADATGYGVTAGTADLLKIANSGAGTGVTYDIVILGTSA